MYSVGYDQYSSGDLGSTKYAVIYLEHDHGAEVKANGGIQRYSFRPLKHESWVQAAAAGSGSRSTEERNLDLCDVQEWQHSRVIKSSIGLCFKERVGFRNITDSLRPGRDDLPVRLIDIHATLDASSDGGICFVQPIDWSFHTLSHTWSLAVRAFSISIGKRVHSAEDYNKAFQGARLHELGGDAGACYFKLLEFLTLLKEEGVKAIWFDALCINQTDTREKDREISRMGAYYGCSLGCYVCAHGIGRGFELWELGVCGGRHLPRWFERVWTLQEFLLPRKVTFIVEGLAKRTIGRVNHFIRQAGVPGLCECALPQRDLFFRASLIKQVDASYSGSWGEEEIMCSSQGQLQTAPRWCERCRCAEFIRKCHEQPGVYYVDREAYYFLCQLDEGPCEVSMADLKDQSRRRWNLFALAHHNDCPKALDKIVDLLRPRDCTNAEDRVLGILGLLSQKDKAAHTLQLRSGKTLSEQLLNLHHYCHVKTFFRLCLMEPMGFMKERGMSWAPCLVEDHPYNPIERGEWDTSACFHPSAGILNVSQRGLKLEAQIAFGHLVPRGQSTKCTSTSRRGAVSFPSSKFCQPTWTHIVSPATRDDCYSCMQHNYSCTHWIRECVLDVGKYHTFPLRAHAREGCAADRQGCHTHRHMLIQDPWIGIASNKRSTNYAQFVMSFSGFSIHALKRFPVWLVLFGKTHECMVGMVCIGNDDQKGSLMQLHKIGIFACRQAHISYDHLFFRDVPRQLCVIGGLHPYYVATHVSHKD